MSWPNTLRNFWAASIFLLSPVCHAQLSGRITDGLTHQPLEGATVRLFPSSSRAVTTGFDGTYAFPAPLPASALLFISRPGYLRDPGTSIQVLGETVRPADKPVLNFELYPAAELEVRLKDSETNKPIPGMILHFQRPGLPIFPAGITTGQNGGAIFRNLSPGPAYLLVEPPPNEPDPADKPPQRGFGDAWYPGVPERSLSVPILVGLGEKRLLEWSLHKQDLHRISGTLALDTEAQVEFFAVNEIRLVRHGFIDPGQPFRLESVSPGNWRIYFRASSSAFGTLETRLTDRDLDDRHVAFVPGAQVTASLRPPDPDIPLPAATLSLKATVRDPRFDTILAQNKPLFGSSVPPGPYYASVQALPPGFAVSGVTVNHVQMPLWAPITVSGPTEIIFTITNKTGSVAGVVRDLNGDPRKAHIALRPDPSPDQFDDSAIRQSYSQPTGLFSFSDLVPGRYRIAILQSDDPAAALTDAQTVEIRPGETARVELLSRWSQGR